MAKDKAPDLFNEIIKSAGERTTKAPQTTHEPPTEAPRTTHEPPTDEPLTKYHVRFYPSTWTRLKSEAKARGLTTSALLRLVIREWLQSG